MVQHIDMGNWDDVRENKCAMHFTRTRRESFVYNVRIMAHVRRAIKFDRNFTFGLKMSGSELNLKEALIARFKWQEYQDSITDQNPMIHFNDGLV